LDEVHLHVSHPLPDGDRVRLRFPHALDRDGLHELLAAFGLAADDLDVRRALRCVPRRRVALCATGWVDGRERLVGFGALEDGVLTVIGSEAVARVLEGALHAHAGPWSRRVA
jgi:hypothetical protein